MTNRLEMALEQVGGVFIEMAKEIRCLKEEIADLQVQINRQETVNEGISKIFHQFYNPNGPSTGGTI